MDAAVKVPLSERINLRVIVFSLIVLAVIGTPVYWFLEETITGGIIDRGEYKEVNLQAMSLFPLDQENGKFEDIPEKWRNLDGQRVILQGEMYAPNSSSSDVSKFDLVYSISKCCNTSAPQVQHFVKSTVTGGRTVPFYGQRVEVTGTLHVKVKKTDAGGIESVYTLDVEKVEPL
jgi:hypothetical protein